VLPPNLAAFYLRLERTGNKGPSRWW